MAAAEHGGTAPDLYQLLGPGGMTPLAGVPGPALRAGLVWVDGPRPAPPSGSWDEEDVRLAVLAVLALRYLAADRGRPW